MESTCALLVWSSICLAAALLLLGHSRRKATAGSGQLPPGPRGWPVFGNMFDMGPMPHHTLASLQPKYGPLIFLRLGTVKTVAVSSVVAATEMFKNHDLSFSDRNIIEALRACSYNQGAVSMVQLGPYWRMLRRLYTTQLFTLKRVNEGAPLRRKCVDDMIGWISEEAKETGCIEVARFVFLMTFNLMGNILLSQDLLDPNSVEGREFFHLSTGLVTLAARPNLADFFPFLQWLDPQGIRRKMERDLGRALEIAAGFVKERTRDHRLGEKNKKNDFLDMLMGFEGNREDELDKISDKNLNILIFELFVTATETTNSTIEWAMTELLCNPETMNKVKAELTRVVGRDRKVEESDIDDLHYLQAVVKEAFRLHPPVPFLIPRRAVQDIQFMGYSIPKDTQVLVNVWAIGRDPATWEDPLSFKPERFLGSNLDYRGQHFEFTPFGAGRRMCPGIPLAHRVLHLVLGSLIHSFDWVLDAGVTPETMDMNEKMGTTLRKEVPLKAIPKPLVL